MKLVELRACMTDGQWSRMSACRCLRSVDTPETVVARYGEDALPEVGVGRCPVFWIRDFAIVMLIGTVDWVRVLPRLSSESARVLPGRLMCAGIHWMWMLWVLLIEERWNLTELQTESDWRARPQERVVRKDCQSVSIWMLLRRWRSWRAEITAGPSSWQLLQHESWKPGDLPDELQWHKTLSVDVYCQAGCGSNVGRYQPVCPKIDIC